MPEGTGFKTVAGGLQGLIFMGGRVGVYVTRNPLRGNSGSRRLCVEPTYRPRLASYNDLVTLIFKKPAYFIQLQILKDLADFLNLFSLSSQY